MAAKKYLNSEGGEIVQKQGTDTSAGAANAGDIMALDAAGKMSATMLPAGVGVLVKNYPTYENLAARDIVSIYLDAGTLKLRKADADNNLAAHAYVIAAVTSPAAADAYFDGIISGFVGLTKGARYYLSATAGGVVDTPPSGAANLVQYLGIAVSDTEIEFDPADYVKLA
jgi:hypothetical protein